MVKTASESKYRGNRIKFLDLFISEHSCWFSENEIPDHKILSYFLLPEENLHKEWKTIHF